MQEPVRDRGRAEGWRGQLLGRYYVAGLAVAIVLVGCVPSRPISRGYVLKQDALFLHNACSLKFGEVVVTTRWPLQASDPYWIARAEVASDTVPLLANTVEGYVVESYGTLNLDEELIINWTEGDDFQGGISIVPAELEPGLVGFGNGMEGELRFRLRGQWEFGC